MSSGAEFVEASIVHQLGDLSQSRLSMGGAPLDLALRASSKMSMAWNSVTQTPYPVNGWQAAPLDAAPWQIKHPKHKNPAKVSRAIKSILEAGADFDLVIDMQDHRTRNLRTDEGDISPLLSFNRLIGKNTGHILWPLPVYHDVDGPEFLGGLDPDHIPWADKKDMAVWRGGPGNRGVLPGGRKSVRMLPLLQKFKNGELDAEATHAVMKSMPRYRFVSNWIDDPRFDIGYTNSDGFVLKDEPFLDVLERPKIPRESFQTYKYIFVLPGSDVGSSFYWTMNSGSVGLVVGCDFETFGTHHFKPWEHYVPVRRDQADIKRIMGWCARHQEECKAMAKRAQEKCKYLADADLRAQTCDGVISRLRQELANNNKTVLR
jgi:hypothetical protein